MFQSFDFKHFSLFHVQKPFIKSKNLESFFHLQTNYRAHFHEK